MFLASSNLQRPRRHNDINIKYRIINDTTVNKSCQDLQCEDWNDIYNKTDVQDAYDHFYKKLLHMFNKNMPLLKPSRKINKDGNKVPWITKGILKSGKTKNMLYKKFIKNPNERNESTYKIYRNKFNKVKNLAKKYYYNKEFSEHKGNLRHLWKLINEVINKSKLKPELPDCFLGNETLISDPTEITNKFNEYFVNVGPKLARKIEIVTQTFQLF